MLSCRKLFCILAGSVFALSLNVIVFAENIGVSSGDNVNVRADASTDAAVYGKLDLNESVEVLSTEGEWVNVAYNSNSDAYVHSDYISITKATGLVEGTNINIRSDASTDSQVVGTVNSGDTVTVIGQNSDWYKIERVNGDAAYVSKQYIKGDLLSLVVDFDGNGQGAAIASTNYVENASQEVTTYAVVTSNSGLKLRSEPSTSSSVIRVLSSGTSVYVLSDEGEWVNVKTDSGEVGYVSKEFVEIKTGVKPTNSLGEEIVSYAKNFIGTPYVWGGTDLENGVDCSGFVYSVMKHFGINLNRSSASMASNGYYVEKSSLQAGDLVLFDDGVNHGSISHVGIYIGGGDYIHSSNGKVWGVTISNLSEDYSANTYVTARRVI